MSEEQNEDLGLNVPTLVTDNLTASEEKELIADKLIKLGAQLPNKKDGLPKWHDALNLALSDSGTVVGSTEDALSLKAALSQIKSLKAKNSEAAENLRLADANLIEAKKESKEIEHGDHAYWWVSFAAKDNPNASDQVILGVNGNILVMKRNVNVILPSNYLEVADHAVAKQYRQLPGESRVIVGEIKTYPYTKIKPATKAEFDKMKREGTKASKASNNKDANE